MKIKILVISSITTFLLVACSPSNPATPIQESTKNILSTETTSPTHTPTLAPTIANTPTHTPSPAPTLDGEAMQELVLALLKTNNGCKLPCFWGIVPGSTSFEQGKQILANLGLILYDAQIYGEKKLASMSIMELYEKKVAIYSGFAVDQDDNISTIGIRATGMDFTVSHYAELQSSLSEYSPQNIMQLYGEPTRAWIVTSARSRFGDGTYFELWLFYDKPGFLISYSELTEFATVYHYCPRFGNNSHIDDIHIILSSPNDLQPLELQYDGYDVLKDYPEYIYPVEKLGYTISEFYEIIGEQKQGGCLTISEETLTK